MKLSSTLKTLAVAAALTIGYATSAFAEGMGTIRVQVGNRTFERQVPLSEIPNLPNGDEDVGGWLAAQGVDNPRWVSTQDDVWLFEADSLPGQAPAATASAPVAPADVTPVAAPQPAPATQPVAPVGGYDTSMLENVSLDTNQLLPGNNWLVVDGDRILQASYRGSTWTAFSQANASRITYDTWDSSQSAHNYRSN